MFLSHLALWCSRHRLLVLAIWVAVLVGGVASAPLLFDRLSSEAGTVADSESGRAAAQLHRTAPSGGSIFAVIDGRPTDAATRRDLTELIHALEQLTGIATVMSPTSTGGNGMVSEDGDSFALTVTFDHSPAGEAAVDEAAELIRAFDAPRVLVGGGELLDQEMEDQAAADLARAEIISLPVALGLLLVLFGGVVAAGIPVLIAVVGVAATLLALLAFSVLGDVSVYAVNVVTMLGLGLAVDYALLLVARYREEGAGGRAAEVVLERTFATAGRTVAFSGLTVAASLAGLLVFPDDFLRSMGIAGLSVVLLDLLAALTLLPAMLALLGSRIRPARTTARTGIRFVSVARWVRRRPLPVALVVCAMLALAATPFFGARYANPDARSLPESSPSRQLAEAARTQFDTTADVDPITVVAQQLDAADTAAYAARLEALPGVAAVQVRADVPDLTVLDVLPTGETQGTVALRVVDDIRALAAPASVQVGGDAAELVDYQQALRERLPWMLAIIVVATFVLLFLFTGSIVVPLKALLLNVLSLGASFGALVWVFQDGHLGGLIGVEALGSLSITTPVLVFAIAFGLSMDYEVFLLGRIAETYRTTGDTDLAVERALQRTGRIVTAAALLVIVVFAGFVAGGFSPVKQVGLGLALAVAVDATLVRMLLLPALMTLMGRWNWWAPSRLQRLTQRLTLREEPAELPAAPRTPVPV